MGKRYIKVRHRSSIAWDLKSWYRHKHFRYKTAAGFYCKIFPFIIIFLSDEAPSHNIINSQESRLFYGGFLLYACRILSLNKTHTHAHIRTHTHTHIHTHKHTEAFIHTHTHTHTHTEAFIHTPHFNWFRRQSFSPSLCSSSCLFKS